LDVEVEGRHDEVQKRSQSWLDWTLKQREGTMKSKKEVKAGWIGTFMQEERQRKSPKRKSKHEKSRKVQKISKSLKSMLTLI